MMKQRYLKVLGLYTLTTGISTMVVTSNCVSNKGLRFILRTALGYGIFAYCLHFLAERKRK